jgi:hypothetical protein
MGDQLLTNNYTGLLNWDGSIWKQKKELVALLQQARINFPSTSQRHLQQQSKGEGLLDFLLFLHKSVVCKIFRLFVFNETRNEKRRQKDRPVP